jgi:hypothetical protein
MIELEGLCYCLIEDPLVVRALALFERFPVSLIDVEENQI